MPRCLYGAMTLMTFIGYPPARTKRNPDQSKGGRLSRGLQLALFEALLSGRPGVLGGKSPEGPTCGATWPDPARAIRDSHHILEHFEQSRRIGPRRSISPAEPLWCLILLEGAQFGRGRGRPKEPFVRFYENCFRQKQFLSVACLHEMM
jgi:hypothetical protein